MNLSTTQATPWRRAVSCALVPGTERVLIVQCSLDWLRPAHLDLREEIDDQVLTCCSSNPDVGIDRLVLHNLPTVQGARDGDLSGLVAAHDEWLSGLAATLLLLPARSAPRIHRLIVASGQGVDVSDGIHVLRHGSWSDGDREPAALQLIEAGRRTTPLTAYDVDLDGPFGDVDPSVYL